MESESGYIAGIDVGSSLLKCQIFDKFGIIRSESSKEIEINIPADGHYEMDPKKLWVDFQEVFKSCLEILQRRSHT